MKRLTFFLLLAILSVPFMQSCNEPVQSADQVALVTIQPAALTAAGFYGLLDNGDRLYPGYMRVEYEPKTEPVRALVYFKEIAEPVTGFKYNADIYNIQELLTQDIKVVNTAAADTLKDGIEILNAYIGGGYINIEFNAYVDPYNSKQEVTVELQDMQIDGMPSYDQYYPLTLGFKCRPALESGTGTLASGIACFYLGNDYSLDNLGCEGFNLLFKGLTDFETEGLESLIVTPNQPKVE